MEMGSRTLIIGVNGFVGEALARHLIECGHSVSGTCLPGTKAPDLPGLICHTCVVDRSPALTSLLAAHEVVVNATGNMRGDRTTEYQQANIQVPEHLAWHLRQITDPPMLLHISSVAAIGPASTGKNATEETPCRPISLYGRTKREGERALLTILRNHPDLPILILRLPSLFGPGDPCFFDLFAWAQRGFFLKLCTRQKVFNLLYIHDLTRILEALINHRPAWRTNPVHLLHIGFPLIISDDHFSESLGQCVNLVLKPLFIGQGLCRLLARIECLVGRLRQKPALFSPSKVDEMSQECWLQSFTRFQALFPGLHPTPLKQALTETFAWYITQGWLA